MSITQTYLDWYNVHHDAATYKDFRDRLIEIDEHDSLNGEMPNVGFVGETLNLLTDAAFERSGSREHAGSESKLMEHVGHLDERLADLAQSHLDKFNHLTSEVRRETFSQAQQKARQTATACSNVQSWRGRVAHAWTETAFYLLLAAEAILNEGCSDTYAGEELGRAMDQLNDGLREAGQNGFKSPMDFVERLKKALWR